MKQSKGVLLGILFCLVASRANAQLENGMDADIVLGQQSFTTANTNQIGRGTFSAPNGVSSDGTRLFISDSSFNRVLIYNAFPNSNFAPADIVVGQSNFAASFSGTSQTTLFVPFHTVTDGKRLFVSDNRNSRILIYNSIPTGNTAAADIVVGQSDFDTAVGGLSQTKFNRPRQIYTDGERLFVTDNNNNRVLIWNSIPTENLAPADIVIGQQDFTTGSSGLNSSKLSSPNGVFYDGKRLFVSDGSNNRVLIWNSIPTANGQPADLVLGQDDFNTNGVGDSGGSRFSTPSGIYSNRKMLFITDTAFDRILIWKEMPTKNNQPADLVIGTDNFFGQAQSMISKNTLNGPSSITIVKNKLIVSDDSNRRVLIFNLSDGEAIKLGPQFTQGKALVGKVFEDINSNGEQDSGERGLEGVKVASDSGIYAITDSDGKYHFPYIETGQRVLKIDESTLPEGSTITTESPRKIVVTEGILSKVSFGVSLDRTRSVEDTFKNMSPPDPVRNAPLLKVTVSQDPVLLKPKLSIEAKQDKDKLIFTIHTNYSLFITKAEIILCDKDLKPFKTIELPNPIPYQYTLDMPPQDPVRNSPIYYQLIVTDKNGKEDRSGVGSVTL